ncbi:MAG: hypothetical protein JSS27_11195 [Planctomycetes bacterium]|nr:hypothetical protein [Planctomycetota bacterium]
MPRCLVNRRAAWLLALLLFAAGRPGLAAETHWLRPALKAGDTATVELLLEVGGNLQVNEQQNVRALPTSVVGKLRYHERLMKLSPDGQQADSLRWYEQTDATIKVNNTVTKPALRDDRKLIAAHLRDDRATLVSPSGPLVQDELELLDVPANTVMLHRLLPDKDVAVNDTWAHGEAVMTTLLGLDAVSQTDVVSQLKEVDATGAKCELFGSVQGAVNGVATSIEVKGRYKFNSAAGRITWLALLIEEKRSIGQVGPGTDVVARLQVTIKPESAPAELADELVAQVPWAVEPGQETLECLLRNGQLQFMHDRRWHVIDESNDAVALRLVDRGELVAQCNISSLPSGKDVTLERFQEDVQRSIQKHFGSFIEAKEGANALGQKVYRVVAAGTVAELPIQWIYYRLSDEQGHQAVFVFTIEEPMLELLSGADQGLFSSAQFIDGKSQTAAVPAAQR